MIPRSILITAGLVTLGLCLLSLRDIPRNHMIRDPQPSATVVVVLILLTVTACVWACVRRSRAAGYASLVASGLGILFSIMLACV
jgi:hypothetical protein